MAMIACKECGHQISSKAKSCPNCGAKVPKTVGILGWMIAALFGIFVFGVASDYEAKMSSAAATARSSAAAAPPQPARQEWRYSEHTDDLEGFTWRTATLRSTNTVDFDFPYNGGSHGLIIVREHQRHGDAIMFRVSKGQILCGSRDCGVTIKAGDREPQRISASTATDGSSDMLFLHNFGPILSHLKPGEELRMQVEFYREASRTFVFDAAGLQWP